MNASSNLPFTVQRDVVIRAPRELVFRFFTDSARWAKWWGAGSTIDSTIGGAVRIVYPDGTAASGKVLELRAPERIVFSYGYEGENKMIAPGASRVTIQLADDPNGTHVSLSHDVADAATRDAHVQGWRYQLSLFANAVAADAHADASDRADRWFAAWNEAGDSARAEAFATLVDAQISFHDAFSCTRGLGDLTAHVTASRHFMPGLTLARSGAARMCQGTALVDWTATRADGTAAGGGINVFEFAPDGRIARVVGFWRQQ
jgi:uncharacterized protein YndB with AHSA1/START domain